MMLKSWVFRLASAEPAPGNWRPIGLALVVHALLFGVLAFGMHWKRSMPAADEGVSWVFPQTLEVAPDPDKNDAENAVPAASSTAKPEAADIKLGPSGSADSDGAPAKNAAQEKSKPAEPVPSEPALTTPAPAAEPADAVADSKNAANDLKIRIAANTQFSVTSAMRETNVGVEFTLRLAADGTIAELQLVQASDNPEYDEAVRQGIIDSQPFPHGPARQDEIDISMRPIEVDFVHRFPGRTTLPNMPK